MVKVIGRGGHAVVVRDVLRFYEDLLSAAFIAVGNNRARRTEALKRPRSRFATLIHPLAYLAPGVEIGAGSIVMAGAIIQPRTRIGRHVIVNTGATVDHHCRIGDYAHIAPGAHLCGRVTVGEGALIGVGVAIAPNTQIPAWTIAKARRLEIEPLSNRA